jgi:hypothetical protein
MNDRLLSDDVFVELGQREAHLRSLWEMTPAERIAAMRRGDLSLVQCCAWASRFPEQVPLINGEYEYLAAFTPEVYERGPKPK